MHLFLEFCLQCQAQAYPFLITEAWLLSAISHLGPLHPLAFRTLLVAHPNQLLYNELPVAALAHKKLFLVSLSIQLYRLTHMQPRSLHGSVRHDAPMTSFSRIEYAS